MQDKLDFQIELVLEVMLERKEITRAKLLKKLHPNVPSYDLDKILTRLKEREIIEEFKGEDEKRAYRLTRKLLQALSFYEMIRKVEQESETNRHLRESYL